MNKTVIRRAKNGDNDAFSVIYDEYAKRIFRYIYLRIRHKETAQDLAGDILLKILEKLDTFDIDRNFDAWVFAICRHTMIDFFRTKKEKANIDMTTVADEHSLDAEVTRMQLYQELFTLLEDLRPVERDVIELTYFAGLNSREISEVIGKSSSNVRIIRHRALQKLKTFLK